MKIVITGATGNVGTSLLEALATDARVDEIVGVARRKPAIAFTKTRFVAADVGEHDLTPHFRGADAVVHLAWIIQPGRDERLLEHVNIGGSGRVFRAALDAGVRTIIHASSSGVYSPGTKHRGVDEAWPRGGIVTSTYSRQKVVVERMLDDLEQEHPGTRIVRMRPTLIFKRKAGSEIKRYFVGPLVPWALLRRGLHLVPDMPQLRFQVVHSTDAAEAYRSALFADVGGAFNIAAREVLDSDALARLFDARKVKVGPKFVRALVHGTFRLHLQPTEPGWFDMALQVPVLNCSRAERELSWEPRYSSAEALLDLVSGIREKAGMRTAPLESAQPHG